MNKDDIVQNELEMMKYMGPKQGESSGDIYDILNSFTGKPPLAISNPTWITKKGMEAYKNGKLITAMMLFNKARMLTNNPALNQMMQQTQTEIDAIKKRGLVPERNPIPFDEVMRNFSGQ